VISELTQERLEVIEEPVGLSTGMARNEGTDLAPELSAVVQQMLLRPRLLQSMKQISVELTS